MSEIWNDCIICGKEMIRVGVYITCTNTIFNDKYWHYGILCPSESIYLEFFNFDIDNNHIHITRGKLGIYISTPTDQIKLDINISFDKFLSYDKLRKLLILL